MTKSQRFSPHDIARCFGIPPFLIGVGSRVWRLGPLTLYVGRQSDAHSHFIRESGMVDVKVRRYYLGLCW